MLHHQQIYIRLAVFAWRFVASFHLKIGPYGSILQLYSGKLPFPGASNENITAFALRGVKPKRPSAQGREVSDELWSLITSCWKNEPSERPDSSQVVRTMQDLISL